MVQVPNTAETANNGPLASSLQYGVASLLARAETVSDALFNAVKKIADSGGWEMGVAWLADESGNLSYQSEWHKAGCDAAGLLGQIQNAESALVAALPGKVLQTGELASASDIRVEPRPALVDVAAGEKRYSALAFPLRYAANTLGVVALFCSSKYDLDDGARRMFEGLAQDIGQFLHARGGYEKRVKQAALHDEVTGLPGWPLFLDRGRQMLLLAERNDSSLAVLHINLDFSAVEQGKEGRHATTHELLARAAERLSSCVRSYDTVARFADNQFTVLLPEMIDADDALVVAQKIIATMSPSLAVAGLEYTVSTSVGIARHPQDGFDMPTLLGQASQALLQAKLLGINQCALYGEFAR
ncbi:diguanylate cyclase domain-containing protein [Eoetvoesiella caeni]|uniref:Diguanylate cyclase (GGDEF)-like protein n=1 Tax=Eoetvoesiella caeni TaxID=645616 RepID=A0A366HDU0_9BURK|nr:diguanylate cyclase [Eoetvoesiella caeni]MCI2808813.1 diguanylate cyclase [Eoetvoesiella caeni]NYT55353.1 diguanylate cyclase [Eoetvoesiella caeni]RBP40665.1 diguanylate cyclase (GGDEF)-like protein [Eoetvoesiella caeni]